MEINTEDLRRMISHLTIVTRIFKVQCVDCYAKGYAEADDMTRAALELMEAGWKIGPKLDEEDGRTYSSSLCPNCRTLIAPE